MALQPFSSQPPAHALYDPAYESDSCGVAFVATMTGQASHDIVQSALLALTNLDHRGAAGYDPASGDGAGILTQVPDAFLRARFAEQDIELPPVGCYAPGLAFLPKDLSAARQARGLIAQIADEEGLRVVGWRDVPTDASGIGADALATMPAMAMLVVADRDGTACGIALDRKAFALRKRVEHATRGTARATYFPSLSSRTLVHKGMLTTHQLGQFFTDLSHPDFASALALVHSRFSTNTFPSWPLAHPFRFIAHNGEINTVKGNRNWMRASEATLVTDAFGPDIARLFPVCSDGASDSASFDEVLELLHLAGRSLPHAVLMMVPEAWERHESMDPARRAFYEYHSTFMEPWDGPACVTFTDGELIGAVLDRNGLRPGRFWVTDDGLVVLASEVGVLDIDPARIVRKGRLQPGKMFLVDTVGGRIIEDDEIKRDLAAAEPYGDWLDKGRVRIEQLPEREHVVHPHESVARRQQVFGYTDEELRVVIAPMAQTGAEAIGSMGTDTPIAVLSDRPRLLFDYFQQLFAQVTNPPLDAIREELVTSLGSSIGPEGNLLSAGPEHCRQVVLPFPVIDNDELAKILHIDADGEHPDFSAAKISGLYSVAGGADAMRARIERICREVTDHAATGRRFVVLSDRDSDGDRAPIPSLLLTSAVHQHLVRERIRTQVSLLVEAGDVREVHHIALLIGYGAAAVNPYLAMETAEDLVRTGLVTGVDEQHAVRNLVKALGKGLLKVMSKMGISTVASYRGAQVFEALGLSSALVNEYFAGTSSRLEGVDLEVIAAEVAARHAVAYPASGIPPAHRTLQTGGEYQWRRDGELHLFNPETVFRLQHATRAKRYDIFKQYTAAVDDSSTRLMTLRGLFEFRTAGHGAIPIDEVESVDSILTRFATGAMSYGSISAEAHETLAIAMNRMGAKSNTGEGGEDPARNVPLANGDSKRSAVKQVASGRFGVTSEYLVNADDIQIKIAQGAKPGEGGQLPGHKVYPWIAQTRYSTPGVGLISPPPHHDIYSIEDLAQLIHDLKNANDEARIHVKLVAEVGVGTVAAGVAKAHADVVLISGHDGGTGASPLTSLKHAGVPWELGLAETQQTLLLNRLRDRITVQVDGQLKTGRDVVIAALLGAEEFGFATAPLVVMGCVMMRVCHLDTCPVGIATQNPVLRERFTGEPEFVQNFFEFVAQEVREYLAAMGLRSLDEAIGRADLLDTAKAVNHWKAHGLDVSPILAGVDTDCAPRRTSPRPTDLHGTLDRTFIKACEAALSNGTPVSAQFEVRNTDRTVGTLLGSRVTRAFGGAGLPDGTINLHLVGSAGQSLGAFLPAGITLRLEGDANDYVAKGLSGGRVIVRPPESARCDDSNVIAGNVIAYGATSGEVFIRGVVGERFGVRNSGATLVVEGTGDHACEYMTGGRVIILGPTGRNVAAGMSGGLAHVLDINPAQVNTELVDVESLRDDDADAVHALLAAHAEHTGSPAALELLATWTTARSRFVTLAPREYRQALARTQSSEVAHG